MISKIYYSIVAFLIIATLVACELFTEGYGDKVDLSNPEITIDSPANGQYVNGQFVLKGTATDDTGVSSVVVEFISGVTNAAVSYTATVSDSNWYLDIDSSNSDIFDDGEVEFNVTVNDTASKNSSKSRILYLDNTKPTVLISSPDSQDLLGVNGVLYISGVASDQKLKTVNVNITSIDGTTTYEGTMDGTNSWKCEINTLNIESEQWYYIEVVAEDYAGNENTYFYYGDDLSSSELKASLGVTNITIEQLTKSSNTNLLTGIQRSSSVNQLKLYVNQDVNIPKIILSSDWDLTLDSNYRDFSGEAILSGRVTDDDGVSTIVLSLYDGVPVEGANPDPVKAGTMYPSDSRSYSFDINLLEDWDDSLFTMSTGESDDILPEGVYYFTLEVTDLEGVSANLPNTAKFGNDSKNPEIIILTPANETTEEINKNSVVGYNSPITITGTSSDDSGIKSLVVEYSLDDGDYTPISVTGDTAWSTTLPEINGIYDVEIIATDNANKTHTEIIKVKFDNTSPIIEVTSPSADEKIFGTDYTIRGTADVEGGSPLTELSYSIDGKVNWISMTPKFSWSYSGIDFTTGGEGEKTLDIRAKDALNPYSYETVNFWYDKGAPEFTSIVGLTEGVQGLKNTNFDLTINAKDGVALKNIVISATKDSITQDISDDGNTANDVNNKTYAFSTSSNTELEGEAVFPIKSSLLEDGLWAYEIIASDMSGQTVRTTRSVLIDKTAPVNLTIDTTTESYVENLLSISGSVSDGASGSGINNVQYDIDSSNSWTDLNGTDSWRGPIDISGLSVGGHTIKIRAIDKVGNTTSSDVSKNFTIDRLDPTLVITTQPETGFQKDDIYLDGTISDDLGLTTPLSVSATLDDVTLVIPSANIDSSKNWSVTVPVNDTTGDGVYKITLTATDGVGRVDSELVTVTVDQNAPDIIINNLEDNQIIESASYTITGTATDAVSGILNVKYRVFDGTDYTPWTNVIGTNSWSLSLDNLDDSISYKIEFRSEDKAGNTSTVSVIPFKVSLTDPIIIENNFTSTNVQNINDNITYRGVYYDGNGVTVSVSGDATKTVTTATLIPIIDIDTENSTFNLNSHGFENGDRILINSTATPIIDGGAKLLPTTKYYIVNKTVNTFNISLTEDGVKLTFTDNGSDLEIYTWSYTEDIDTDGSGADSGLAEGSYTLKFKATDGAGEITTLNQSIFIDTTKPVLEITKPISGTFSGDINDPSLDTFDGKLSGKVSDSNGIGVTELQYKIDSGLWNDIDIKYGWSKTGVTLSGDQGSRTISFRASDGLNTTLDQITVYYDKAVPTLTQDSIVKINEEVTSTTVDDTNIDSLNFNYLTKLTGVVSDTSSLTSLQLSINGADAIYPNVDGVTSFIYTDDNWHYNIESDGDYNLVFTATDIAGRTSTIERNVIVDTTVPTIDTVEENFGNYVDSTISIDGTASDATSKLDSIKYRFNGSDGDAATGTLNGKDDWYGSIKVNSDGANLKAGDHTIYIWAVDNVGNKSIESSSTFKIDRKSPVINSFTILDNSSNDFINATSTNNLTITASVAEDYNMDTLKLSYSDINGDIKEIELSSPAVSVRDSVTDTITYTYTDSTSLLSSTIKEGTTKFTLTATDKLEKVTTKEISILKDTISPVIDFISPEVTTDINGIINIKGTTSDSNMSSIELFYDGVSTSGINTTTADSFVAGSSLYSWTYKLDTTDVITGTKEVLLVATDSNGNSTSSTKSLTINQSADIPEISDVNSTEFDNNLATANTYILDHSTNNNVLFGITTSVTTTLDASKISVKVNSESNDRTPVILSVDGTKFVSWYLDLSDLDDLDSFSDDESDPVVLVCNYTDTVADLENYLGLRGSLSNMGKTVEYLSTSDKISGYATDDDNIDPTTIDISKNGSVISTNKTVGTKSQNVKWSYDLKDESSGLTLFNIYAKDIKKDGYGDAKSSDSFKSLVVIDSSSPVIDAKLKDTNDNEIEHQGAYVNGTVIAHGTATDDLSIKKFTITAKKATGSVEVVAISSESTDSNLGTTDIFDLKDTELHSTTDKKEWDWKFALERLPDAYEDNSISLIYEATDVVGNVTTVEKLITVDTANPEISVSYPLEGNVVNGDVVLRGTTDDVALSYMDIAIGRYKDVDGASISEADWNGTKTIEGTYNWSSDIQNIESFANKTYAYAHEETVNTPDFILDDTTYSSLSALEAVKGTLVEWDTENRIYQLTSQDVYYRKVSGELEGYEPLWDLYIYIRATDKAGNFDYEKHLIVIDAAGDRPTISISTPKQSAKIGGAVNVMGVAQDDDGLYNVYMRIDANSDGLYENLELIDGSFFDEREIIEVNNTYNWNYEINKDGELYPDSTIDNYGEITLEVWAVDTKDNINPGVESSRTSVTFTMDNTVPIIENVEFDAVEYIGGESKNGSIVIDAIVKDPLVGGESDNISSISVSTDGVYWSDITEGTTTLSIKSGLTGYVLTPIADDDFDKYSLTWTYDTTNDENNSPKTLGIRVFDGDYYSIKYLSFNIDNLAPTMSVTAPYSDGWNTIESDSEDISGEDYWIRGSSYDAAGLSKVDLYFVRNNKVSLVDKDSVSWNWDSSDLSEITKETLETKSDYSISIDNKIEDYSDSGTNGDEDGFSESLSSDIGDVNWGVKIPANKFLDDGTITVYYIAYDNSGNAKLGSRGGIVSNFKPLIDSVQIGYDVDPGMSTNIKLYDYTYSQDVYPEIIKDLEVRINTSGVNGASISKIEVLYNDTVKISSTEATLDDNITYSSAGNFTYTIKVTDTNGAVTKQKINSAIKASDDIKPELYFYPFDAQYRLLNNKIITEDVSGAVLIDNINDDGYVTSTLNSSSELQGHIELKEHSLHNNTVNVTDADADVSGKVVLKGFVYDNTDIESLEFYINDTLVGTTESTVTGIKTHMNNADLLIYSDLNNNNEFDSGEDSVTYTEDGASFNWEYTWDSSSLTGVVGNNIKLSFKATDYAGLESFNNSLSESDMQVDVVPYITDITTTKTNNGGIKEINIRSTDGKYSVKKGTDSTFITINGYNLNPITDGVRLTSENVKTGNNGTTLLGNSIPFTGVDTDKYTSLSISNNISKSGNIHIVSGTTTVPISSINNNNLDESYNMEKDTTLRKNKLLNDNRYLSLFETSTTGISDAIYPNMIMNSDTPYFGYIQSGASSDLQLRRGSSSTINTPMVRILAADQVAMAKDDGGRYHMITVNNFSGGRIVYFNNTFATDYGNDGYTEPFWVDQGTEKTWSNRNNAIQMEDVNSDGLQLGRYVRPVLKVTGDSTTSGGHANLYMTYYDLKTNNLLFRNWQVGKTVSNRAQYLEGNIYESNLSRNDTNGRQTISSSASEHFSMDVTSTGVVYVGYYDQSVSKFKVRYSSTTDGGTTSKALDAANPSTTVYWSAPITLSQSYVGWFPSMTIDAEDDIHISAYDSGNASLSYIYLDHSDYTSPTVVTVDTFNSVGYYSDIKIDSSGLPWIAYYNTSETGSMDSIRLAEYQGEIGTALAGVDSLDYVTGSWKVSTVPVESVPRGNSSNFLKVNLGFDTTNKPVIGFTGDSLEYSKPLDEL